MVVWGSGIGGLWRVVGGAAAEPVGVEEEGAEGEPCAAVVGGVLTVEVTGRGEQVVRWRRRRLRRVLWLRRRRGRLGVTR